MKLNKAQTQFLLRTWFSTWDLKKIFETFDLVWLDKQEFELRNENLGWPEVWMNDCFYTRINNSTYADDYKELLSL